MQYEQLVALLPDYLNGSLPDSDRLMIEQQLAQSTELREALSSLQLLEQTRRNWQDEPAPEWHRTAYLARRQKQSTGWLPWLSMATSFAAICLVLFRVEIVASSEGLHIGFGEPTTRVAIRQQTEQYLEDWQEEQQAYVAHKLLEYENSQLRRDQQLMATVLELNKEQRRQDLQHLTAFLAKQRNHDIELTQSQYQALYEIQDQDRKDIRNLYASLND